MSVPTSSATGSSRTPIRWRRCPVCLHLILLSSLSIHPPTIPTRTPKTIPFCAPRTHGARISTVADVHLGRHRWIDFSQDDFNASQVPPEWHSWLSHIRKDPPHEDPMVQSSTPPWKAVSVSPSSQHSRTTYGGDADGCAQQTAFCGESDRDEGTVCPILDDGAEDQGMGA